MTQGSSPSTRSATSSSLAARLHSSREEAKAKSDALRREYLESRDRRVSRLSSPAVKRATRSPSAVPAVEVVPMPTYEENRTSERYPTLVPDHPEIPPSLRRGSTNIEVPAEVIAAMQPASNEFEVPITLSGRQQDSYKEIIKYNRGFIETFTSRLWPDDSVEFAKAKRLVNELEQVILHPDLLEEETFTQAQADPLAKARWDEDASAKFGFLSHFLTSVRDEEMHVIITFETPRLQTILDNFLTGKDISHSLDPQQSMSSGHGALKVTLLPNDRAPNESILPTNLVIVMEASRRTNQDLFSIVRKRSDGGALAPFITLVVPKSIEHIERSMVEPLSASNASGMLALINTVAETRNEAGKRLGLYMDPKTTAQTVAQYVLGGCKSDAWPIETLPRAVLSAPDLTPETSSGDEMIESSADAPTSNKRPLVSRHFFSDRAWC